MDFHKVEKIKDSLLLAVLFLLPLQTRYFLKTVYLDGVFWEYGSLYVYAVEILVAFILFIQIYLFFKNKIFLNSLNKHSNTGALVIFFALFLSYLFLSKDFWVTWQYFGYVFYAFGLSVILLTSRLQLKYLILSFWSGALVTSVLSIWQFLSQSTFSNKWLGMASHAPSALGAAVVEFQDERWLRAYGFFGWPTSLAIYLAVAFLMGLFLVSFFNNRFRFFVVIGQVFILTAIFFTFARGAWLALIFALILMALKNFNSQFFRQQFYLFAAVFVILVIIFKPLVFNRFNLSNRLESRSVNQRLEQWSDFKRVFKSNEFFGVGPGLYTKALYDRHLKNDYDLQPVHNVFILFLGEWGVVGIVIFSYLLLYYKKMIDWSFPPFWALLIFGFFDHWLISMFTGMLLLGLTIGFSRRLSAIDTLG